MSLKKKVNQIAESRINYSSIRWQFTKSNRWHPLASQRKTMYKGKKFAE